MRDVEEGFETLVHICSLTEYKPKFLFLFVEYLGVDRSLNNYMYTKKGIRYALNVTSFLILFDRISQYLNSKNPHRTL